MNIGFKVLRLTISSQNRLSAARFLSSDASAKTETLKRDWDIDLGRTDDDKAYTIRVNKINLKTPLKNILRIRDETLALAIANEFKSQPFKKKLNLPTMHLTTLAYEAIDNPFKETREEVANSILEYLKFDTVRFRDSQDEELLAKQSRHWDPIIGWFEHQYDLHVPIEYGDIVSFGSIPQSTGDKVIRLLLSHERWPLVGIRHIAQSLKSFILATCLTERFLKVEHAVSLTQLETTHQTDKWTEVEWGHKLDEQCTNARAAAGTLFYHLSL